MSRSDRPNLDRSEDEDEHKLLRDVECLERQVVLDLVAADISHELAHTLNFLRYLLAAATESDSLSPDESRMTQKEVERLQRVLGYLRKLKLPPPARQPVDIRDVIERARAELASLLADREILFSVAVAEGIVIRTDPHLVYILLRMMIAEVVRRAARSTAVEIHAASLEDGSGTEIQIWGRASPVHPQLADDSFNLWTTLSNRISDQELPVAYRISRILGWQLSILRNGEREGLQIAIPTSAMFWENRL